MSTDLNSPDLCWKSLQELQEQINELPLQLQENLSNSLQKLSAQLQELAISYQSLCQEKLVATDDQKLHSLEQIVTQKNAKIRDLEAQLQKEKTQQRIVTQELTKSENRLQTILRHSSDLITIIDAGGRIRYLSPAIEKILGYKPQERIGKIHGELMHPDDVASWQSYFENLLATPGVAQPIEYRKRHANGSWVYIEAIANNLLLDSNLKGIVINARDITKRKQVEMDLQKSTQQMINVLESITDGFFAIDHEWCFTYLNQKAEQFLKKSRQELLGKNVWEELPEAIRLTLFEQLHQAISEQVCIELEWFEPNFKAWLEFSACPSEEGLSVYFRDITERKRIEEKERQKRDMEEPFWVRYISPPKRLQNNEEKG